MKKGEDTAFLFAEAAPQPKLKTSMSHQNNGEGAPDKKDAAPVSVQWSMELLPGFEPGTSSLPTILEAVLPCASYRKLLDKTLVYQ